VTIENLKKNRQPVMDGRQSEPRREPITDGAGKAWIK